MAVSQRDLDLMAWTLLGEAAGEGIKGMQAVANVIVNRANSGQYPSSIGKVVLQPKQFSTWNTGEGGNDPVGQYSKNSEAFQTARAIAEQAVSGKLPDITGGALNYWSPRGMKNGADPYWAKNVPADQRLQIGNHVFLPTHPVPPAPLLAEAPIPATMSRELAYARGLTDPSSALAAIENATGENATAGINAYSPESGKLTTVSRPVYSVGPGGVPFTPQVAGDLRRQIGTQPYSPLEDRMFAALANAPKPAASTTSAAPTNWQDFYASVGIPTQTDTSSFVPRDQALPPMASAPEPKNWYKDLLEQAVLGEIANSKWSLSPNPPVQPAYASDEALKRLAAQSAPTPVATDLGSAQYDPAAALAALAMTKPRTTLNDIMGTAARAPSAIRYPGITGSNEQPLGERPSSVGPAPAVNPLLAWAQGQASTPPIRTDVSAFAPRPQSLPPTATDISAFAPRSQALPPEAPELRPVSNLITPPSATELDLGIQSLKPSTGLGFGYTLPGFLPAAEQAASQQMFVSPTPASPAVNRKGYYVGNPMGNYEVGRGETLAKIAKQFNTSVDTLAGVNNIPNPNKISSGAKLFVPTLSPTPVAAKSGTTATPTGGTVTSAQRTAIASSGSGTSSGGYSGPSTTSGYTSTPTSYAPSTRSTTSSTGVSIPVYSSASITPTRVATATTPTGGTITQAQMNAIRGLATGGMVPGYEYGGYIPGGTNTPGTQTTYAQDAQRMANALNTVKTASAFIPVVNTATAIGNIVAPQATRDLQASVANQIALAGSPTSGYPRALSRDPSSYEGSPSSSYSGGGDYSSGTSTRSSKTTSAPTGGIDGVSGSYTPPTQAQIDALYAPYFRAAVFPPAGYQPGISGEFNYFPQVAAPTTSAPAPQSSWLAKASDWFKSYSDSLGSRSSYDAAKQIKAPDGTSLYTLYKRFRDSLNHDTSPTLGTWQSWLATKGYATGGQISEPRLVLGKGGPTEDKIPARIDGVQEARLSNGEFVMTAAAVRGLGNGDYKRGAEALMRLNDQFAPRREKGTLKVEKVR